MFGPPQCPVFSSIAWGSAIPPFPPWDTPTHSPESSSAADSAPIPSFLCMTFPFLSPTRSGSSGLTIAAWARNLAQGARKDDATTALRGP